MKGERLRATKTRAGGQATKASPSPKPTPHPVLQLQADIGNGATNSILKKRGRQNASPGLLIQGKPMFGGLTGELLGENSIQTKLTLGAVGDKYEQEADRVAAEVTSRLNGPIGEVAPEGQSSSGAAPVQRKTAPSPIQAKEGGAISPELETSIQQAKGGGNPLPKPLRSKMEQAFGGADFGGVKVHTGAEGDTLNRSIQARAFTTGQDIFFRQGAYNPGSKGGQELIAHELTHTIQQGAAPLQRQADQQPILPQINSNPVSDIQCKYLENQELFEKNTPSKTEKNRIILREIDELLIDYEQTITNVELQDETTKVATSKNHLNKKLNKLLDLGEKVQYFIELSVEKEQKNRSQNLRINTILDLQKEIQFAIENTLEAQSELHENVEDNKVEHQANKLRSKSMDAALKSGVAKTIDAVLPEGSLSKFSSNLSIAIDVHPPAYVGFDLGLEVERKQKDRILVRAELAVSGGARIPKVFDLKGKLGGYVEAEAKDSEKAMSLISYGLYNKAIESKSMPSRLAGLIWGGSLRKRGKIKAAEWAADIEKEVLEKDEDAYIDLGLLLGIGATGGDTETVAAGVEYKYTTGTKYTKESVEKAGGLGQVTKESLGGKTKKGSDTSAHYFTTKMTTKPFNGQIDYKKSGEAQEFGGKVTFNKLPKLVTLLAGLEGIITSFKSAYETKSKTGKVAEGTQGLDSLFGVMQLLSKPDSVVNSIPTTSTKGEIAVILQKDNSKANWKGSIIIYQITEAPSLNLGAVGVKANKSDTRFKLDYEGKKWKLAHIG